MKYRTTASSLAAVATVLLVAYPATAVGQTTAKETDKQRIDRLEATVQRLEQRLAEKDAKDAAAAQQAAADRAVAQQAATDAAAAQQAAAAVAAQQTAAAERPKTPSDHHLELYGFAQVDAIQDFKRVDPSWDATLRPSKIPTSEGQFGSDGQTVFSVRQSRLGAKATGTLAGHEYEAKFEFDLYGTGVDAGQTTMRVRHAYAKWGPILAGQTNSLFMDGDLFPNVMDYWGPAGMVFVRNPQLRYTFLNNKGWQAAVALEHPSDDIDPGSIRLIDPELATNLRANEELPDLTLMVRYDADWGHIQLSGLARKIGFDTAGVPGNEPSGDEFGWGLNLGTSFKWSLATFRIGAVYGEGIASYMNDGGMDLAPKVALIPTPPIFPPPPAPPLNELVDAKAVPLFGLTAYVDLQWSEHWTSSFGYSFDQVDNTNFQDPTAFHKGEYASGNILWAPAPPIVTGLEMLWGKRTDNDGATGEDIRAQFSFKVSFSSKNLWGD